MSTFKNWTEAEIYAHNAKVAGEKAQPVGEGCDDESKLHEQIAAECRQRGWWFSRSRMDRATTTCLGNPDFLIFADGGRTFAIECKTAKGKVTREQAGTLHWLTNLGHKAAVVRSLNEFLLVIASPPTPNEAQAP